MTALTQGTWVLVADGSKALFLENRTDDADPFLEVVRHAEQDNPPNREQGTGRPGRLSDGPSGHRSAVGNTDWHQLGKDRFATELAQMLYRLAHRGRFERLVLVSDPGTLGALRDELHPEVAGKVVGEIPKTLTNHPIPEIEKIVKAALT